MAMLRKESHVRIEVVLVENNPEYEDLQARLQRYLISLKCIQAGGARLGAEQIFNTLNKEYQKTTAALEYLNSNYKSLMDTYSDRIFDHFDFEFVRYQDEVDALQKLFPKGARALADFEKTYNAKAWASYKGDEDAKKEIKTERERLVDVDNQVHRLVRELKYLFTADKLTMERALTCAKTLLQWHENLVESRPLTAARAA